MQYFADITASFCYITDSASLGMAGRLLVRPVVGLFLADLGSGAKTLRITRKSYIIWNPLPSRVWGETEMTNRLWLLSIKIQNLLKREDGQDLIEYALVVALIGFAATAGMSTLANDINNAFSSIGSTLSTTV
jgi:pilus assembly protein Flp/PilA